MIVLLSLTGGPQILRNAYFSRIDPLVACNAAWHRLTPQVT